MKAFSRWDKSLSPFPPSYLSGTRVDWRKQMHRSMWHAACSTDGGLDLWLMHIPQLVALVFLPLKWRSINSIDLAALASINGSCSCPRCLPRHLYHYLCPPGAPRSTSRWMPSSGIDSLSFECKNREKFLKSATQKRAYNECIRSVIHAVRCLIGHSGRVKWTVIFEC